MHLQVSIHQSQWNGSRGVQHVQFNFPQYTTRFAPLCMDREHRELNTNCQMASYFCPASISTPHHHAAILSRETKVKRPSRYQYLKPVRQARYRLQARCRNIPRSSHRCRARDRLLNKLAAFRREAFTVLSTNHLNFVCPGAGARLGRSRYLTEYLQCACDKLSSRMVVRCRGVVKLGREVLSFLVWAATPPLQRPPGSFPPEITENASATVGFLLSNGSCQVRR